MSTIHAITTLRRNRALVWAILLLAVVVVLLAGLARPAQAQTVPIPRITMPSIQIGTEPAKQPQQVSMALQIMFLLTTLSLAPYILIMATSFIRITIVLSFLRTALGTQQVPPTQVLMGLALFMTLYVMMPVVMKMKETAYDPYMKQQISVAEAAQKALVPLREFMLSQTRSKDLKLFVKLGHMEDKVKSKKDVPIHVLLPAFIISEVKVAFEIGFMLYLPFLIIDMVVASVLMSMGMFMLSPMSISLPFKLLLFVMIDGWDLIVEGLVKSFHTT